MESGTTLPDLNTFSAAEYEGFDPKFVAFPDFSRIVDYLSSPQPESLASPSSIVRKLRKDERSGKGYELLATSRTKFHQSGSKVDELIHFNVAQETESVSGSHD
jgi:hypothetical protein